MSLLWRVGARSRAGFPLKRASTWRDDARHCQAAPCDRQNWRARPLAEDLVGDARVCQGRQGRLLLPARAEVQNEVRDFGFSDKANLDEGALWPIAFALKELTATEEAKIVALV